MKQPRYGFRTAPMFLMFYQGRLVAASNPLHGTADLQAAALAAQTQGRKKQFLPDIFSLAGVNINNSSLDFIRHDMRLVL